MARRELWDAARIVANRLDLLGAIRYELPKPTTAYVYMCDLDRLTWWYEAPDKEKCAELGVFTGLLKAAQTQARYETMDEKALTRELKQLEKAMLEAARNLEFERAAQLRDQLRALKERLFIEIA